MTRIGCSAQFMPDFVSFYNGNPKASLATSTILTMSTECRRPGVCLAMAERSTPAARFLPSPGRQGPGILEPSGLLGFTVSNWPGFRAFRFSRSRVQGCGN